MRKKHLEMLVRAKASVTIILNLPQQTSNLEFVFHVTFVVKLLSLFLQKLSHILG